MMSSVIIRQTQDTCKDFLEMEGNSDAAENKVSGSKEKRSQIACDSRGEGLCLLGRAVEGVKDVLPRAMAGGGNFL